MAYGQEFIIEYHTNFLSSDWKNYSAAVVYIPAGESTGRVNIGRTPPTAWRFQGEGGGGFPTYKADDLSFTHVISAANTFEFNGKLRMYDESNNMRTLYIDESGWVRARD